MSMSEEERKILTNQHSPQKAENTLSANNSLIIAQENANKSFLSKLARRQNADNKSFSPSPIY